MPRKKSSEDVAYKDSNDVARSAIKYGTEDISTKEDRKDAHDYIQQIPKQDWKEEGVTISNLKPSDYEEAHKKVDDHYNKQESKETRK